MNFREEQMIAVVSFGDVTHISIKDHLPQQLVDALSVGETDHGRECFDLLTAGW